MDSYIEAATAAANLERCARVGYLMSKKERIEAFEEAEKLWGRAERIARSNNDEDHEKWANARADWCLRGRGEWKFGGE